MSVLVTEGTDSQALARPRGAAGRGLCLGKTCPSPAVGQTHVPDTRAYIQRWSQLVKPNQTSEIPGSPPGNEGWRRDAVCFLQH